MRFAKSAFEEGSVGEIFKLFIRPLLRYKPENISLDMYMDMLFHEDTRTIFRYVVATPFTMPGLLCAAAHVKLQGLGVRAVGADQTVWVRHDSTVPDVTEIEWNGAGREQIFSLDTSQWNSVAPHLKKADK